MIDKMIDGLTRMCVRAKQIGNWKMTELISNSGIKWDRFWK